MLLTSLLGLATPAHACGGLFCNVAQPVVQDAERIVFDVDQATGDVDVHVQIFYSGPADEFAWVVPVPAAPELFVSSQAMFDSLAQRTGPIFQLNTVIEGDCAPLINPPMAFGGNEMAMADGGFYSSSYGGVTVVDQGQVGPYETVTLRATSGEALIGYLQANKYDLPSDLSAVLDPYTGTEDGHFVALRLQKDRDVGDIAPLGMTYPGDAASIPIQLTSVAASDDMRLEVYVFADERAVPKSYFHVEINDAAVDWWNRGTNYPQVITEAANEAGGHAFATDYFGPSEQFAVDYDFDTSRLRAVNNALDWIFEIARQGVPLNEQVASVIASHVDVPDGVDPINFVNCPDCFEGWNRFDFDPIVATDDLRERVLEPLERFEDLFDRAFMTRMTSSLDAIEMTVDPVFVLNPDMSGKDKRVVQQRVADQVFECGFGRQMFRAPRRLELADGRVIDLPSQEWFSEQGTTEWEFLADLRAQNAQLVEQLGEEGQGSVVTDLTDDFYALTDLHNQQVRDLLRGCGGCSAGGGPTGGLALLGLLGVLMMRRRSEGV